MKKTNLKYEAKKKEIQTHKTIEALVMLSEANNLATDKSYNKEISFSCRHLEAFGKMAYSAGTCQISLSLSPLALF